MVPVPHGTGAAVRFISVCIKWAKCSVCIASVCCVRCAGCAGGQRVARCLPRSDGRQVPLPHLLWTQVSVLRLDCLNGSHFTMLHRLSGNLSLAKLSHHADTLLSFRSFRVKSHLFSLPYWQYVWCVRARLSSFWLCFDSLLLSPFLTGRMFVRPNILRILRWTMIRFLTERLVRRIWFGQSKVYFILNWLVMRCKLRPELAADAQQTAWYKM